MDDETHLNPKVGMEKFVKDGNEAVELKLIRKLQDLDDPKLSFHPSMCHQIFGEGETIFGYENLMIKLYFTAGSLLPYAGIKYTNKINPAMSEGVEPDDILDKLKSSMPMPENMLTNFDDFTGSIEKETETFVPLGELVHSFTKNVNYRSTTSPRNGAANGVSNGHMEERVFEIYYCDITVPKFVAHLKRMEAFCLWFIDAGSFLDIDDEKWKFFVLYEKYKTSQGTLAYAFIGYSAVYNFYCYPLNTRPRVAQMLILPPFQKQGLGVELLSSIYSSYRRDNTVVEITIEDPSDEFEELRDYVDSRDCMKLASFAPEKLKKGYSDEMKEEAHKTLKMTNRQTRRIYEILRLRLTNPNNEDEFKNFRLDVKDRLNIPYKKQMKDIERLKKKNFNTAELQKAQVIDEQSRLTELESNFQNLYAHYKKVIGRLEKYD